MPIHSLLTANSYRVTADSGIQIDASTGVATRRRTVVFRGSLKQLHDTFAFGEQVEEPESLETRMFCTGPQGVRMIDGTSATPHWEADIEHIGLHSYTNGTGSSCFRITPLWTSRETTLPQSYGTGDDSETLLPGYPLIPTGALALVCTIHDHQPGFQVRGVMVDTLPPHPKHTQFATLKTRLSLLIPSSVINANCIDYSANTGAGYNWSKDMPTATAAAKPDIGSWFIGDISAERVIEPADTASLLGGLKIYQFTMSTRWLQRKLPV